MWHESCWHWISVGSIGFNYRKCANRPFSDHVMVPQRTVFFNCGPKHLHPRAYVCMIYEKGKFDRGRTSSSLNWENKSNKLKRSIGSLFKKMPQPSNKHSFAQNLLNVSSYSNCLYHSCIVVGKDDADEVKNMILKALVMRYTSFMLTMAK